MKIDVQDAAALSELIAAAERGEEVELCRDGVAVAKLVAIPRNGFRFGLLEGKVGDVPDFLEPMSEGELRRWEGG